MRRERFLYAWEYQMDQAEQIGPITEPRMKGGEWMMPSKAELLQENDELREALANIQNQISELLSDEPDDDAEGE